MNKISVNYIWENIKADRGKYFVEYIPLRDKGLFASVNLVYLEPINASEVAKAMEKEFDTWINRFPLPIMVSSFDEMGNIISLDSVRPTSHLVGFIEFKKDLKVKQWRLLPNDAFPKDQLRENYIKKVYNGLSYKTKEELEQQNKKHRKQIRIGFFVLFLWAVIVPAIIAILGWASFWISTMVLVYSLWKAIEKGLKMKGKWKKSEKDKMKNEKELKMRHYYYHCELNPEGFRKIFIENMEKEEKNSIKKEADSLHVK